MTWVHNKCYGARFRILPNSRIQVEGRPYLTAETNPARLQNLKQTWENWKPIIIKWSKIRTQECIDKKKENPQAECVPITPAQILAIMTQETGHLSKNKSVQANAVSPAGATGLMQIMPARVFWKGSELHKMILTHDRKNPDHSVKLGSWLLQRMLASQKGLPAAASNYNAGSVTCDKGLHEKNIFNWHHEQNYAEKVTAYHNAAVDMGVDESFYETGQMGMVALGFVVAGVTIATVEKMKKKRRRKN